MRNSILSAALVASAVLGGIVGGGIQANRDVAAAKRINAFESFDYDQCNWIVADLKRIPDNWKELTPTPGGNWCVHTEG